MKIYSITYLYYWTYVIRLGRVGEARSEGGLRLCGLKINDVEI